jgi:FO synthase
LWHEFATGAKKDRGRARPVDTWLADDLEYGISQPFEEPRAMITPTDRRAWLALHPALSDVLERALSGQTLSAADGYALIRSAAADLPSIVAAAGFLRDQGRGRTVSYSRKVFIPLTNLCRDKCGYCTFAKAPKAPDAKTMDRDEVLAVARAGRAAGCKEALFSLGERPEERYALARAQLRRLGHERTNDYLAEMCALVFEETGLIPHTNAGVMSRADLERLREINGSMGIMLESVSERLLERGQAHFGCVGKVPSVRLEMMALAGELGIAFTTGILIGIGETLEERVDSLLAIRDLHRRYGHIQEVIIQNFRVKPTIRMRKWPEPTISEMVRTIAVARLLLGPEMNIQAPPNLVMESNADDTAFAPADDGGPVDLNGMAGYLAAGINDWGGISPVTIDHINPERAWPAIPRLRAITAEADFDLRERLCLYPEYLDQPRFVRERLRGTMMAWADERGLVRQEETRWT